jgi:hypothetical protein
MKGEVQPQASRADLRVQLQGEVQPQASRADLKMKLGMPTR